MGTRPHDHPLIGLDDVERAVREIEKGHCCNVHVKMSVPATQGTPVLFWVSLHAEPRIVGRRTIRQPVAVSHRWPSVDFATFYGLLLSLCYKLDRTLDEYGHVPAEQAAFPWDT